MELFSILFYIDNLAWTQRRWQM